MRLSKYRKECIIDGILWLKIGKGRYRARNCTNTGYATDNMCNCQYCQEAKIKDSKGYILINV
jgi:hypothetical protein